MSKLLKHKKLLLAIGSAVLAALLIFGGVKLAYATGIFHKGDLTGEAAYQQVVGRAIPELRINEDGTFRILQLNDTHLNTGGKWNGKDKRTLAAIEACLAEQKPDLVILGGDIFDGHLKYIYEDKRGALETLAGLLEAADIWWAYVPGNNDGRALGGTADTVAAAAAYEHCIVGNAPGITGAAQFVVPLLNEVGEPAHYLVFMDSLDYALKGGYDFMKADQVAWLADALTVCKTESPQARASVFFHANTPAFAQAGRAGTPYDASGKYAPIPKDFWDGIEGNEAVDDAISAVGNVTMVSIGHIHPAQNLASYYDGILYHVVRASG